MVREIAARLWAMAWFSAARLLVFVDAGVDPADPAGVAWHAINSPGLARALFYDSNQQRMALDATGSGSRSLLTGDLAMVQQVQRRWQEYGIPQQ